MKNIRLRLFITVIAIAIAIFSYARYISLQKEKNILSENLAKTKQTLEEVQKKKAIVDEELSQMTQKNKSLSDEVAQTKDALKTKLIELDTVKKVLTDLEQDNKGLMDKISSLRGEREALRLRLATLTAEKEELVNKLSSLDELRKLTREVNRKQRIQKILALKEENIKNLREGNRGYIIKDGKSQLGPKVTVKVLPAKL